MALPITATHTVSTIAVTNIILPFLNLFTWSFDLIKLCRSLAGLYPKSDAKIRGFPISHKLYARNRPLSPHFLDASQKQIYAVAGDNVIFAEDNDIFGKDYIIFFSGTF